MNREYPDRPKMAAWAQYLFMTFGIANIAGVIISLHFSQFDLFRLLGEFLVGSAWFSFGLYGGLPLVSTVSEWELATEPDTISKYASSRSIGDETTKMDDLRVYSMCARYRSCSDSCFNSGRRTRAYRAHFGDSVSNYQPSLFP